MPNNRALIPSGRTHRWEGKVANLKTEVKRKQSTPNFPKNKKFLPSYRYVPPTNYWLTWNGCLSVRVTWPLLHLLPCVPVRLHKGFPVWPPIKTYMFKVFTCGPYMWYQNVRHFPPVSPVAGMSVLIKRAVPFDFLLDASK